MSTTELHALLADPALAGAYFVDARDRAAISEAGNVLGFAVLAIELRDCCDADEAMRRFATTLQFPGWFGDNWDALADALADLSWLPAPGYLLLLDHAQGWREAAPDEFDLLLEIVDEAAGRWAACGVAFWAMLPLPTAVLAAQDHQGMSE